MRVWRMAVLAWLSCACSSSVGLARYHPPQDAGADAGSGLDAGVDAGPSDGGPSDAGPVDAGPVDAGPVDAGPGDAGLADAGWTGTWEPVGPPLGRDAQVYPSMAFDPSGRLLVAYVDLLKAPGLSATELHVVRWTGSDWEPLGGTVASSDSRFPYSAPLWVRLATDGAGRPVLAFGDSGPQSTSGSFPVQTWVFDGTAWQPVPVPGMAPFLNGLALGRGADGLVRLALSTGRELNVWTLGAQGWTAAVAPLVDDGGVSEPDLALALDGSPLVVFSEAQAPGSFGSLRAWRWSGSGWTDLGLPSPAGAGLLFHTPRVRLQTDGGVVVAASEWQYDVATKVQMGMAVPVFALGEPGWMPLDQDGVPGGSGLSEPIAGSPVGLQLAADVPIVLSTGTDGGTELRALPADGVPRVAPEIQGAAAGTLLLAPDGAPLVGAVTPLTSRSDPSQVDGGQVQILRFTGVPFGAPGLGMSPGRRAR